MKKILLLATALFFVNTFAIAQLIENLDVKSEKDGRYETTIQGVMITGFVLNGEKNGTWIEYYPNEMPRKIMDYKSGKLDGVCFEINKYGFLEQQSEYTNDILDGRLVQWAQGGYMKLIENYTMGQLNGERKTFYDNRGKIQEEANYKNGKRDGKTVWYRENGTIMATYNYKDDLFEGVSENYYEDGNIKSSKIYKNNQLNGLNREYHPNGTIASETNYVNGKQKGETKNFSEDGKQIKK